MGHHTCQVRGGELVGKSGAFRTLLNAVKRAMKDKVANVYLASLTAFSSLIDGFSASTGGRDIQVRPWPTCSTELMIYAPCLWLGRMPALRVARLM